MVDEEIIAMALDSHGVLVVLLARIWHAKIVPLHPEVEVHLGEVLRTVEHPVHVEADGKFVLRRRYYRREVRPSRWLRVVVSYEQVPARIITAFGHSRRPITWSM